MRPRATGLVTGQRTGPRPPGSHRDGLSCPHSRHRSLYCSTTARSGDSDETHDFTCPHFLPSAPTHACPFLPTTKRCRQRPPLPSWTRPPQLSVSMEVGLGCPAKHKEMQFWRPVYPKMLFVVYLIFRFSWVSCICWIWRPQVSVCFHLSL